MAKEKRKREESKQRNRFIDRLATASLPALCALKKERVLLLGKEVENGTFRLRLDSHLRNEMQMLLALERIRVL